jgi:hypothetical protein
MRIYILLVVLHFDFAPALGIIHIKDGVGEGERSLLLLYL